MTALKALVRKDLILYLNDKRALLLHLLMPVVLAAFFGSLFGGAGGGANTGKIDIGLVQQDQGAIGQKIAEGLKAESSLRVAELSLEEAQSRVREGKLAVAVVIPSGFGETAGTALFSAGGKPEIPMFYDPSQSTVLAMVKGLLTQQVMQTVSAEMFGGATGRQFTDTSLKALEGERSNDPDAAALHDLLGSLQKFQAHEDKLAGGSGKGQAGLSMPFSTKDEALSSGPKYNGYAHSFAGMSVQFILMMGIDIGISILLARRMGIWSRLLAAPLSQSQILLSRAISGALISLGLLAAIFLCGVLIFKVEISNLPGFVVVGAAFALMTASFGLLIAAFGRTPEAARGMAVFATLIMVMLGGAWVPSFVFPEWMQAATVVIPTRWAVDGLDAVTWRGLGMDVALRSAAVQLAFAAAFAGLAIWRFRRQQA
ncbi:ABC transporter permease [Pseudoduganella violacea]|uniref:ABC-2 type transport system permease protein n=1 Tax=Pseudoduganella violacea TaxID=1715466 RepID=A0A7W5BAA4_9BURK|nr:ABC transporter permease [Pseudoduganella violacea]MBB3119080.1 ABC-2 type transport system permease protein [Pseudoduganella violacea]